MKPISLALEVFYRNGKESVYRSRLKGKMVAKINKIDAKKVDHYYFCVTYLPGVFNDGFYFTKKDLLNGYRKFTTDDEVKFVSKYWGKERPVALV